MNNNIEYTRFVSVTNWRWRSRSQRIYPYKLDFTVEDERYCLQTKQFIQNYKVIPLQAQYQEPFDQENAYSPHILFLEGEDDTQIDPSNNIGNYLDFRNYHRIKKQIRLLGDIPFEFNKRTLIRIRHEFQRSAYILDKLYRTYRSRRRVPRLTTNQIEEQTLQDNEYFLEKQDYIEVIKDLNRNPDQTIRTTNLVIRPIKTVYFSHEIRYFAKDRKVPPSDNLPPIKDFTFIGDPSNQTIIIGKIERGSRDTRTTVPPYQSILKVGSLLTRRNSFWENKLERQQTRYKHHRVIAPIVRANIFCELKLDNSDNFNDWFNNTQFIIKNPEGLLRTYLYYINRKFRHDLINEAIIARVKSTLAANKILNTWRVQVNKRKRV